MLRVSLVLALLAAAMPAGAGPRATGRALPDTVQQIPLRELVDFPGNLRFTGNSGSRSFVFRCEPNSAPGPGSVLHLVIEHSPGLDGSRSFLSITLNYGVLRSVRLDQENQGPTELDIALPQPLLKAENELSLSVEQFAKPGVAAESAWTAISPRSYLSLSYERRRAALDLGALPLALLDAVPGRPRAFDVLVPTRAATPTLEATALLLATFASRVAPEPVYARVVHSVRGAQHSVIIVGTPSEQPKLRAMGVRAESGALAGLVDAGGGAPALYVTGATPEMVLRAARGLIWPESNLSGALATFPSDVAPPARRPREWSGFMPPADRFSLADLGFGELKLAGASGFSASIPLRATPDTAFLAYGAEMVLSFTFDPDVYDLNPELAIEMNGAALKSTAVRSVSNRPQFSYPVPVPAGLLRPQNTVRVLLRGPMEKIGPDSAAWLLRDTQFYLPRDYRSEFPDLSLLRQHLFPFSLQADLSDTVVLVPDVLDEHLFGALIGLAAGMGRLMPGGGAAFAVRRTGDVKPGGIGSSHIVYLGAGGRVYPNWLGTTRAPASHGAPVVQESVSVWDATKCVLTITAGTTASLEQAVDRLFSETVLAQLSGDTAYLTAYGPRCVALGRKRKFEESSFLRHMQARLRANWMALPAIVFLVSGILFVGLRLALAHYKNGRA